MAKANPYLDTDLEGLTEACHARAGDLLEPRQRTRDERAELAEDTGYLLLAIARRIDPGWHGASGPERELEDMGDLAARFGEWAELKQKALRYEVLLRAANVVQGGSAHIWIREARLDGERAYTLAIESDDGLARVLAHLQELAVASGRKPGRQRR